MQRAQFEIFRDPKTRDPLVLQVEETRNSDVVSGTLLGNGTQYPIVGGVPRFTPKENYAESFGYQWHRFATTQLDSRASWGAESERRLFEETGWGRDLSGERILEAGSGMGRFTEVLAKTGAQIHTFDYSAAIEVNLTNNGASERVSFAQADIFSPPYEEASFDKVLCIGVIQHTPNPELAFRSLVRFLKPGGQIVIDVYRLSWKSLLMGKYYLRPLTSRLTNAQAHRFVRAHLAWTYPLTGMLHRAVGKRARALSTILGIADYRGVFALDPLAARDLAELDTFDMLAPAFDKPQSLATVRAWFEQAGLEGIRVRPGYNGVEAIGRRPA